MKVAIVILAAGKSTRTGAEHKLLAEFGGTSLIRRSVLTAIASNNADIVVVTGHRTEDIEAQISDLPVKIVHNDLYTAGMSSSLSLGVAIAERYAPHGIMIALSDMPELTSSNLNVLFEAFRTTQGKSIVRAVSGSMPGHPVIFPASLYARLKMLTGDGGARDIIATCGLAIVTVDIGAAAVLDVDTAEAVTNAGGRWRR